MSRGLHYCPSFSVGRTLPAKGVVDKSLAQKDRPVDERVEREGYVARGTAAVFEHASAAGFDDATKMLPAAGSSGLRPFSREYAIGYLDGLDTLPADHAADLRRRWQFRWVREVEIRSRRATA